ncbi:hypothetical protein [Marinospirillum insulare]|uniref:Uncharacterized protein n=1 Tax=Marinospirillum insulare TaxID=217169 RepID=A0ABQ6A2B6_9GAMM|nr:hypothetical protein [Marinospirillum insulare]GLR65056.1 hypothetical protein GCM10007878_24950 [Marinospirillum insulare]
MKNYLYEGQPRVWGLNSEDEEEMDMFFPLVATSEGTNPDGGEAILAISLTSPNAYPLLKSDLISELERLAPFISLEQALANYLQFPISQTLSVEEYLKLLSELKPHIYTLLKGAYSKHPIDDGNVKDIQLDDAGYAASNAIAHACQATFGKVEG